MKKLSFLTLALIFNLFSYAGDIIVTKDKQKIDAIIQEVAPKEIRYKKASNPNGPTFVIFTSDISTIVFSNGDVEIYNLEEEKPKPKEPREIPQPHKPTPEKPQVFQEPNFEEQITYFEQVTQSGDYYILKGKRLTKDEFLQHLQMNCDITYRNYLQGQKCWAAGWTCFGIGAPLFVAGLGCIMIPAAGIPLLTIGDLLITASVPLLSVGAYKRNNIHNSYNEYCAKDISKIELKLQSSQNGLGLALNF